MSSNGITITLSNSEALVLFDVLSRYGDGKIDYSVTVIDAPERQALWNLCCLIEKELAEPFSEKYAELLASAKSNLNFEGGAPFPDK